MASGPIGGKLSISGRMSVGSLFLILMWETTSRIIEGSTPCIDRSIGSLIRIKLAWKRHLNNPYLHAPTPIQGVDLPICLKGSTYVSQIPYFEMTIFVQATLRNPRKSHFYNSKLILKDSQVSLPISFWIFFV